MVPGVSSM